MRRTLLLLALATLGVIALGATASAQPYDDGYAEYVIDADTVEVWAGDGWYPAQILQVSGNSYLVHYLNSTSEYDEWVDAWIRHRKGCNVRSAASAESVSSRYQPLRSTGTAAALYSSMYSSSESLAPSPFQSLAG